MKKALVSIARLGTYDPGEVREAMRLVLEPLGGMKAFARPECRALVKPNFLWPSAIEKSVCTHPEIARAAARLLREAGAAEVTLTDSPGVGSATRCARKLGMGGDEPFCVVDADEGFEAEGEGYRKLRMSRLVRGADLVVNLPKAKTHGQMVLTGAVKNCFGAVVGMDKAQWHFRAGRDHLAFARLLVHVHSLVAPGLSILDGVIGMQGNGPGSGDPRPLGVLVASADAHALDAILARILGVDAAAVPTLVAAREAGLLPESIEIAGPEPESLRPRPAWRLARPAIIRTFGGPEFLSPIMDRLIGMRPVIDLEKCSSCGRCAEICAARAITMQGMEGATGPKPVIDRKACIACFCCQEVCPEGAIRVRSGPGARLFGIGTR
jgi:uncharacterized protein (DUF362 family)/NAD-dependent dihydropyrimidine dehydrogenase PreA subunit